VRLDDLPPNLRRQIAAGKAIIPTAARRTGTRSPAPRRRSGGRWTCGRCGASFGTYVVAETHVDTAHHAGRIEWSDR
jgi:hypothetical protein